MRIVVISDTHLESVASGSRRGAPVRGGRLPRLALELLAGADAVLHAGDILDAGVLAELEALAPTRAVLGNNDRSLLGHLPESLVVDLDGVRVGVVHDAGPSRGREARMARRFPDAAVVVHGHSHVPSITEGLGGQLLVNPGSPTQRRSQPHHTIATLELRAGAVGEVRLVVVDDPPG